MTRPSSAEADEDGGPCRVAELGTTDAAAGDHLQMRSLGDVDGTAFGSLIGRLDVKDPLAASNIQ